MEELILRMCVSALVRQRLVGEIWQIFHNHYVALANGAMRRAAPSVAARSHEK